MRTFLIGRGSCIRALAAYALFCAALAAPQAALCEEPQTYFSRHFTLWFYSMDGFDAFEASFRDGPLAGKSGYGPESDFLAGRLEALYGLTSESLGMSVRGHRVKLVLLDEAEKSGDIFNARGLAMTEGAAFYDPRTVTLYVRPGRAGPCDVALELSNAILHAGTLMPAGSDARYMLSVPAAEEVCGQLSEYGMPAGHAGRVLH